MKNYHKCQQSLCEYKRRSFLNMCRGKSAIALLEAENRNQRKKYLNKVLS